MKHFLGFVLLVFSTQEISKKALLEMFNWVPNTPLLRYSLCLVNKKIAHEME